MAPYDAKLSVDAVGQPYVAAGITRFGGMYGGGVSFTMSDTLGNHNLYAAVDVNSYGGAFSDIYKNTGAYAAYTNLSRRWNWGIAGGQLPYVVGGLASGVGTVNGQPAVVEQQVIYRETHRGASGSVAYPFDKTRRIELGTGYQHITFEQDVRTRAYSIRSGDQIDDSRETISLANPLHLAKRERRVRHRQLGLRCNEPGRRPALAVRGLANRRHAGLHVGACRLPALLHAGAVLHDRRTRHALRPLRRRQRGRPAASAFHGLSRVDSRLQLRFVPSE